MWTLSVVTEVLSIDSHVYELKVTDLYCGSVGVGKVCNSSRWVVCPLLVFFNLLQRPDTSLPARYFCREGLYTAGPFVAGIPSHK